MKSGRNRHKVFKTGPRPLQQDNGLYNRLKWDFSLAFEIFFWPSQKKIRDARVLQFRKNDNLSKNPKLMGYFSANLAVPYCKSWWARSSHRWAAWRGTPSSRCTWSGWSWGGWGASPWWRTIRPGESTDGQQFKFIFQTVKKRRTNFIVVHFNRPLNQFHPTGPFLAPKLIILFNSSMYFFKI